MTDWRVAFTGAMPCAAGPRPGDCTPLWLAEKAEVLTNRLDGPRANPARGEATVVAGK